ncbi:MAG: LysE family translocator [Muribaculaceae bacterium]|nr:LysE family translocator [Muribaculaceae bacterium]
MAQLLLMILRGIVIGVVVSAPMGPVGIYCIQRTLDKGRLSGLYTGIGASVSDLIYCLLTGFGLSFIEDFINIHRSPIQLIGSVVLIFFGIWLIRKKPDGSIAADADHGAPSREGDILKGFALTFSNPLILFLIIGLFAQFNFVIEGMKFYHYILGFVGIIAGALGWWWLVTYFVDKLRGHFTQRTMKFINMVIGIIILIFAAVGIISSTSSMLTARNVRGPSLSDSMTLSFRVADNKMRGWYVVFPCENGKELRMQITPLSVEDPFGDSCVDALNLQVFVLPENEELASAIVSQGVDTYRGKNSWRIRQIGNQWNIFVGNREYNHVLTFECPFDMSGKPEIVAQQPGVISVSEFCFDKPHNDTFDLSEDDVLLALKEYSGKRNELPGIYSILDYEFDDTYARPGGSYRLAVVPDGETGCFDIYYLEGAKINNVLWSPGMKKGRLMPTNFPNIFNVEWRDAEGEIMCHDIQAEFDPLVLLLAIKFPYQSSTMRYRKE